MLMEKLGALSENEKLHLLSWLLVLHDIDQVSPGCLGRRPSLLPSPACSSPPCWPASLEQIQSLQKISGNEFIFRRNLNKKCVTCCQERGIQWRCTVGFELLQRWPMMPRSSFSRLAAEPWEREIDSLSEQILGHVLGSNLLDALVHGDGQHPLLHLVMLGSRQVRLVRQWDLPKNESEQINC